MTTFDTAEINACCADAYSHPAARFLLGESLHPGGLDLTADLAHRMRLSEDDHVLDAGCGPGATAIYLAEELGCRVTGVTLEAGAVTELDHRAEEAGLADQISVIRGDISDIDLPQAGFDAAVAECVVSIFARKAEALARIHDALKPGARLGLTDVTVSGPLPEALQGIFAVAGCVGNAVSLEQYASLVEDAGFVVTECAPLPDIARDFLKGIRKKMMFAEIGAKLGKIPVSVESVKMAKGVLKETEELVNSGTLGYGMIVAERR